MTELELEFREYARLAKLRIPYVADGYRLALDAYQCERKNPTPLMRQAAENVLTSKETVYEKSARWAWPDGRPDL